MPTVTGGREPSFIRASPTGNMAPQQTTAAVAQR